MKTIRLRMLLLFLCGLLISCATLTGGNGSETTNGMVVGVVFNQKGAPAGRARVELLPTDYDPVKGSNIVPAVTTDSLGRYAFSSVAPGVYNIQAGQIGNGTKSLVVGVHVVQDTIKAPNGILEVPGAIKISLSTEMNRTTGYLYIPGTKYYVSLNNDDDFVFLDSVPAGTIPSISYSSTSIAVSAVIRYNVPIIPGDTTVVWDLPWKYARRLFLNTTTGGANVSGEVYNFPVLVRLTTGNFTFVQAKADGGDIRFTKNDGTSLAYQIERWDTGAGLAEVWVKVDTVYGNDSTQSITMYCGNPNAFDKSNGAAVFDTAKGFQGVWHLNRKFDDATYDGNNGTNYGATDTTGIIGYCKKFDGSDSIKIAGLLGSPASITMSAWTQLDSSFGNGSEVVSIGDAAFIRLDYPANNLGTGGAVHLSDNDSVFAHVGSGKYLKQTGWHFITITHSETDFATSVYIDGVIAGVRTDPNKPISYSGLGQNTYIGKHGNGKTGYDFYGKIDEVRVYREAVSADYIRLCYMNQRQDDRLVVFK